MKKNENNNSQQFIDNAMKESFLESPSPDFTAKVMAGIMAFEKNKAIVYKPLISKKGWVTIFGGIVAALTYLFVNGASPSAGKVWPFVSGLKELMIHAGESRLFQFSQNTGYIILIATMMIFVQITMLKNHLDKRSEM